MGFLCYSSHYRTAVAGLVRSYLALSKIKEALQAAREAMKIMPQSAKALKLVGDVHASNSGGREKVTLHLNCNFYVLNPYEICTVLLRTRFELCHPLFF